MIIVLQGLIPLKMDQGKHLSLMRKRKKINQMEIHVYPVQKGLRWEACNLNYGGESIFVFVGIDKLAEIQLGLIGSLVRKGSRPSPPIKQI